jgi:hypothetical protein
LILGGDLIDAHTLGPMTSQRVRTAVAYAETHADAVFYCAAGVFEGFKDMERPMADLVAEAALLGGLAVQVIGPDTDFNTRGELREFNEVVPAYEPKSVISTWWHLPRIKRIITREWGEEAAGTWEYIKAPGPLTLKLGFLEVLKWILTFAPEGIRQGMVDLYRKLFGRSSW